jgi:hypothetical protein
MRHVGRPDIVFQAVGRGETVAHPRAALAGVADLKVGADLHVVYQNGQLHDAKTIQPPKSRSRSRG